MREGQTGSAPCRSLSHAGDPADMRLVGSDPARRHILHDRIGSWCTEGNIMELRHAQHVAHRVAEPVGMVALEEIGFADCQRPDGAQRNVEIVFLGHRAIAPDREVAIRRAEAEIELCGQGHAAELYISGLAAKARTATGLRRRSFDPGSPADNDYRKKQLIPAWSPLTSSPSSAKPVIVP